MGKIRLIRQREAIFRIRKMREDLGYSQEQFADMVGINISTYKKIEAYDRRVSLDNLEALHQKLNVSVDYILYGDKTTQKQVWSSVLNCTEMDKIILFLRLFGYLTRNRPEIYPVDDNIALSLDEVISMLTKGQNMEGLKEI